MAKSKSKKTKTRRAPRQYAKRVRHHVAKTPLAATGGAIISAVEIFGTPGGEASKSAIGELMSPGTVDHRLHYAMSAVKANAMDPKKVGPVLVGLAISAFGRKIPVVGPMANRMVKKVTHHPL